MRNLILIIFSVISFNTFGQVKDEKNLYVVDSIAIMDDPDEGEGTLFENEIANINIVTNPDEISKYRYNDYNKIIFILTKEYVQRPDSIKNTPTTKQMIKKDGKWYLNNLSIPYTGKFIDYYYNGKKFESGFFRDGLREGLCVIYYKNGQKEVIVNYSNGKANGDYCEYFTNGQLKQQGVFTIGKENGVWKEWYSTGVLKKELEYKDAKPLFTKEVVKLNNLISKGLQSQKEGEYKLSQKYFNKAIELFPNLSDLYFHRSRAFLYDLQFDKAIDDCDKAIALEPFYKEAYSNRAFTRIRKYELTGNRVLLENTEVTVFAGKAKTDIPLNEKDKICNDLKQDFELGDTQDLIKNAIKKYCE